MISKCLINCNNTVTFIDYYGTHKFSCNEIKSLMYYNPGVLMNANCYDTLSGVHPCDMNSMYCNNYFTNTLLLIGITLFVITMIILIKARSMLLNASLKKQNLKMIRKGKMYHFKEGEVTVFKRSIFRVFLFLLTGVKLVGACLTFDNDKQLVGFGGDTICTKMGNITIPMIERAVILSLSYTSSDWFYYNNITWGCGGGSCPDVTCCSSMSDSAAVINKKEGKVFKSMCKNFPRSCAFGRGCVFGSHVLSLFNSFEVFKISRIMNRHREDFMIKDCNFYFEIPYNQILGPLSIVKNDKNYWICGEDVFYGVATHGSLGDLQIYNSSVIFDWDSIKCGTDWFVNECTLKSSFYQNINNFCTELPTSTNLGFFKIRNGEIYLTSEIQYYIKTNCSLSDLIINNVSCTIRQLDLWGTRSHNSGVYLVISGQSNQEGTLYTLQHPCDQSQSITIRCNGEINYYPISEELTYKCINVTDKTLSNSMVYIMQHHNDMSFGDIDSFLHSSFSFLSFLGLSSTSIVLWIIIITILIRR